LKRAAVIEVSGPKLSRLHGGWRERDKPGQTDILSVGGSDDKAGTWSECSKRGD